jgi:hypothetical protein
MSPLSKQPGTQDHKNTGRPCPPDDMCVEDGIPRAPSSGFFKGLGVMIPLGVLFWAAVIVLIWWIAF